MKAVKCARCGARLFDAREDSQGVIVIKCRRCGSFNTIDLSAGARSEQRAPEPKSNAS